MSLNEIIGMGFVSVRQKQNFHPFDKANVLYDPGYMVQLSLFSEVWTELIKNTCKTCIVIMSLKKLLAEGRFSNLLIVTSYKTLYLTRRCRPYNLHLLPQFTFCGQSQLPISLLNLVPLAHFLRLALPLSQMTNPLQSLPSGSVDPLGKSEQAEPHRPFVVQSQFPISLLKAVFGGQRLGFGIPASQMKNAVQSSGSASRIPGL